MSLIELLVLLLVASITGSIGRGLAGYSHSGCLLSIVVGFIGAFLGEWLAREMELPPIFTIHIGGRAFPIVWAIIGSFLFSLVVSVLTRGKE
jgi:uncharacterized membrane protein YeaQ/YmgE (transglycosylase-associated protein family)